MTRRDLNGIVAFGKGCPKMPTPARSGAQWKLRGPLDATCSGRTCQFAATGTSFASRIEQLWRVTKSTARNRQTRALRQHSTKVR
jgi:hypothetical protein